MAREYAKAWFSMFTDEHFTSQPRIDKLLYITLLAQPSLNYAGILPLNFRRWGKALREGVAIADERQIKAALIRLERNGYVYTDEDTGEVLVRSFIRRDQVDRQPNVLLSALRFAAAVESPKLGHVLLAELKRISMPEVKGDKPGACKLRDNLKQTLAAAQTHLRTLSEGLGEPFPEPFSEDFPEGLDEALPPPAETEPFKEPFREGLGEPPVVVEVEVAKSPLGGTWVGEGHGPRPQCSRHPEGNPNDEPCKGCQRIREWDKLREASDELVAKRQRNWLLKNCTRCHGTNTYENDLGGVAICRPHVAPSQEAVNQ